MRNAQADDYISTFSATGGSTSLYIVEIGWKVRSAANFKVQLFTCRAARFRKAEACSSDPAVCEPHWTRPLDMFQAD